MRIVSLLPGATEIICELGLGEQLVGVSHECDFPPLARSLPKVTRTRIPLDASSRDIDAIVREQMSAQQALYWLDLPTLESLRPDLIVTQTLCNVCAVADSDVRAAVAKLPGQVKVVNLGPARLADLFQCLRLVAHAAGAPDRAERVVAQAETRIENVVRRTRAATRRPRVVFLEWIDPPFCAGHWTPELIDLAGGTEMIGRAGIPSRAVSWDEIIRADPEVLFIACCGFNAERTRRDLPLLAAQPGYDRLACVRAGKVCWTDGSAYFNRPGPRLVDSLEILAHALHPTLHPAPPGPPAVQWRVNHPNGGE